MTKIMMMMGVCAAILYTQPALAEWQYTTWGMTQEEVVAASDGKALPNPEIEGQSTSEAIGALMVPYSSGKFKFRTVFNFDRKSSLLTRVSLQLIDGSKCGFLLGALSQKYGEPTGSESTLTEVRKWRDTVNQNAVIYLRIGGDYCTVEYKPLVSENEEGL